MDMGKVGIVFICWMLQPPHVNHVSGFKQIIQCLNRCYGDWSTRGKSVQIWIKVTIKITIHNSISSAEVWSQVKYFAKIIWVVCIWAVYVQNGDREQINAVIIMYLPFGSIVSEASWNGILFRKRMATPLALLEKPNQPSVASAMQLLCVSCRNTVCFKGWVRDLRNASRF